MTESVHTHVTDCSCSAVIFEDAFVLQKEVFKEGKVIISCFEQVKLLL